MSYLAPYLKVKEFQSASAHSYFPKGSRGAESAVTIDSIGLYYPVTIKYIAGYANEYHPTIWRDKSPLACNIIILQIIYFTNHIAVYPARDPFKCEYGIRCCLMRRFSKGHFYNSYGVNSDNQA